MNQEENVILTDIFNSNITQIFEETKGTQITMYERCKETGILIRVIHHKQTIRHISDFDKDYKNQRLTDNNFFYDFINDM